MKLRTAALAMLFGIASINADSAELLILNKADATLIFVDPATGQIGATVPTGDGPHEIELSSDGKLAFIGNYGTQTPGSSLSIVDVQTRKELRRVELGELKRPHGLAFHDGKLYFTSEASKRVARFDPKTDRIDWQFETAQTSTHMVLASRDGSKLFTANIGSNNVGILEREKNGEWRQTLVAVGNGPEGMDLSANGKELWVAHSRDGGVSIIDVADKKVAHRFDVDTQRSNRLKFSRDGRLALISDLAAGELVVVDTQSRSVKSKIKLCRTPTGILTAPDGLAYVACSGDNKIAAIDLKTFQVAKSISTGSSPDGMAWVK